MKLTNMKLVNKVSGIFLLFISSFALAGGVTPFTDQLPLAHIQDSDLTTDWSSLTPLVGADIETMVRSMRDKAGTNAATLHNAIGIRSGMVLREDGNWVTKVIKNAEGLNGAVVPSSETLHNITWYPDYMEGNTTLTTKVRITSGRFRMGAMPLLGQAYLEIPIDNIRKEVAVVNNATVATKYWFKAVVTGDSTTGYTTSLPVATNYYEVLGIKAPILDFLGYYDVDSGEWKVKFVINSKDQIILPEDGYPGLTHPDLDLEVYSNGTALQLPVPTN